MVHFRAVVPPAVGVPTLGGPSVTAIVLPLSTMLDAVNVVVAVT